VVHLTGSCGEVPGCDIDWRSVRDPHLVEAAATESLDLRLANPRAGGLSRPEALLRHRHGNPLRLETRRLIEFCR
jgi:hypothetical protein